MRVDPDGLAVVVDGFLESGLSCKGMRSVLRAGVQWDKSSGPACNKPSPRPGLDHGTD